MQKIHIISTIQFPKNVKDVFKLTRNEIRTIGALERGQAIIYSNSSKIPVEIYASPKEHDLITTDPKELERIAREKLLMQMRERNEQNG